MNKKNVLKFGFVLLVALFSLFVVGCSNGVEETVSTGFVRFDGRTDASRSLKQTNENIYKIEDLYWTYTAKKIDGLYTEGESAKIDTAKGILNPGSGSTVYVERPVKQGPATGLDAQVGPFATGDWEFNIYGYVNCVVESGVAKYKTLVYKGVTSPVNIAVKKLAGSPIPEVAFELTATSVVPVTGKLVIGNLRFILPETDGLFTKTTASMSELTGVDSVLKVRIWDATEGLASMTLIATSTNTVSEDIKAGDTVYLEPFVIESGEDVIDVSDTDEGHKGTRIFVLSAEYQDRFTKYAADNIAAPIGSAIYDGKLYNYKSGTDEYYCYEKGWASVGSIMTIPVQFYAGAITTLSGDLNDISGVREDSPDGQFEAPLARVLKAGKTAATATDADYDYFMRLQDAYNATTSTNNTVEILRDVKNETLKGNTTHKVNISLNGYGFTNVLWIAGSTNQVYILPDGANTSEDFRLFGNEHERTLIRDFHYDLSKKTLWVDTDGGTVGIILKSWDVWHTGSIDVVHVYDALDDKTNNKGYHVHCDVDNTLELKTDAGSVYDSFFLDLGNVHIKHIGIPIEVEYNIRGCAGTVIDNMNDVRDSVTNWNGKNAEKGLVKITLHGNNTGVNKATEDTKKIYGIEGVPVQLPECDTYASSPVFTRVCGAFKYWNTVAAGTGTNYANNEFYIPAVPATTAVNLYAQWGAPRDLKPVGGRIYAIGDNLADVVSVSGNADGEVLYQSVVYRFFNADGSPINLNGKKYIKSSSGFPKNITDETLLAAIGSKAYYATSAAPADKYFHVYDTANKLVGGPGTGMSYGGHGATLTGLTWAEGVLNANETRTRCVWTEDGRIKAGYEVLLLNRDNGSKDVGDGKTFWSYIDYINDYGNDRFYGDGAKHGWGEKKPGGCGDWVLPWGRDLVALASWSGALASGGSAWSVKLDTAATPPSDPDRAEVFEWFKTKDIALSVMVNGSWFCHWGYEYDAGGSYAGVGQFKINGSSYSGKPKGGKCYDYAYCLAVRNF